MTEELAAVVQKMRVERAHEDLLMPEAVEDLFATRWMSVLRGFPSLVDNDDAWELAKAGYLRGLQDARKWQALAQALEDLLG